MVISASIIKVFIENVISRNQKPWRSSLIFTTGGQTFICVWAWRMTWAADFQCVCVCVEKMVNLSAVWIMHCIVLERLMRKHSKLFRSPSSPIKEEPETVASDCRNSGRLRSSSCWWCGVTWLTPSVSLDSGLCLVPVQIYIKNS